MTLGRSKAIFESDADHEHPGAGLRVAAQAYQHMGVFPNEANTNRLLYDISKGVGSELFTTSRSSTENEEVEGNWC